MALFGWKAGPEEYPPVELMEYAVTAGQLWIYGNLKETLAGHTDCPVSRRGVF